jgi:hypothetical protein
MQLHRLASVIFVLTLSSAPTLGCSCVQPPPGTATARDLAEWRANRSDAIFEGRVESVELKWAVMEAKVGTVIPADLEEDSPEMQVAFDVSRSYRGEQQKHIRIRTGVGGGDCGFDFQVSEQYLVYAFAGESGKLSAGICSGTARLEESKADISYLRGEAIVSENVERNGHVATGKLCGRVVRAGLDFADSQLFLLRVGNKSPIPSDEAELGRDGSFCATDVIPGKYYLLFMNRDEGSPTSFVFFPGVTKSSEAEPMEVKSGQANSALVFNVPTQPTFSVSGTVLVSNKSAVPTGSKVILLSAEPLSFLQAYSQDIPPNGAFEFAQVLPGKYWALVTVDSDDTSKWLTRKVEVDVDVRTTNLSLELIAK